MPVIPTALDRRSDAFRANEAAMRALVEDLRDKSATIGEGGDEASRKRHQGRGKLLARERVRLLIDPGSPFLELSAFAAYVAKSAWSWLESGVVRLPWFVMERTT